MERYVKRGKYDFRSNDDSLTTYIQTEIKHIIVECETSDEQMAHTKKLLDSQSGAFIDSLNEFILTYSSINQMSANDFFLCRTDYALKYINHIQDQYEDVPYSLYYRLP